MGEIAEALERAREAKQQADEAADASMAASRSSAPASPERPAAARDRTPRDAAPRSPVTRELSLEGVRPSRPNRVSTSPSMGAARERLEGAQPERSIVLSREKTDDHWRARAVIVDPQSPSAVRFPHLAVRIRVELDRCRVPSLLVTSASKGEGKTTVSTNLALALAMIASDRRVAFVDMDLRSASLAAVMGVRSGPGIEDVLAGTCELEAARLSTDVASLDLYPVIRPTRQAHELLGWAAERVLRELGERYDYVIADGPPVLPVPDTPLLAPLFGGCLVVVRSRFTRHSAFHELLDLVPRAQVLGVFLNDAMERRDHDGYGYYGRNIEVEEDEDAPDGSGSASGTGAVPPRKIDLQEVAR